VVPKGLSGLGELPEMIDAIREKNKRREKVSGKVLRVSDLLPVTFGAGIGGYTGSSFNVQLKRLSDGETPNRRDPVRLEFKDSDGRGTTGSSISPTCFLQDAFLEWGEAGYGFEEKDSRKVTPSPEDWLRFWEELEEDGVWAWQEHYDPGLMICDGTNWGVEIKKPGRRKLDSGGSNAYPDEGFGEFLGSVSKLLGGLEFS